MKRKYLITTAVFLLIANFITAQANNKVTFINERSNNNSNVIVLNNFNNKNVINNHTTEHLNKLDENETIVFSEVFDNSDTGFASECINSSVSKNSKTSFETEDYINNQFSSDNSDTEFNIMIIDAVNNVSQNKNNNSVKIYNYDNSDTGSIF